MTTGPQPPSPSGPAARPTAPGPAAATAPGPPSVPARAARRGGRGASAVGYWLPPALLMLVLGLTGVGHRQPWEDEYATWWAAHLSWGDLGRLLANVDIVLAPYYALVHLWIAVFGDSAAALRIPSVLAMAGAAAGIALLGRRLFDSRVGLTAGLVFAVIPMCTRYAQEARPYGFAVLAAVTATLLLYRALDRPSRGRWAAYAALVTAMGLAHLVTLTILAAHLIAVLTADRAEPAPEPTRARKRRGARGPAVRAWLVSTAAGLVPVAPVVWLGHAQDKQIAWLTQQNPSLAQLPQQLFHSANAAWAIIAAGLLGLLLTRRRAAVLLCWAVLPPVLLYATRSVLNLFLNRYLIFTLPAWSLLAGAGLCALVRLLPGRSAAWGQVVAAVLAAAALLLGTSADLAQVRADPLPGEPNWRDATAWMTKQSRPGDGLAFNGYREGQLALAYQLRDVRNPPREVFLARTAQSLGQFDPQNCADPAKCATGVKRIWLFSTAPQGHSYDQMPTSIGALFAKHYRVSESKPFSSVRVLLLVSTDGG